MVSSLLKKCIFFSLLYGFSQYFSRGLYPRTSPVIDVTRAAGIPIQKTFAVVARNVKLQKNIHVAHESKMEPVVILLIMSSSRDVVLRIDYR